MALQAADAGPRRLRADARRNRERVLLAARAVFAQYGHDAQMDEIARHAEVGVGTVYRHFPTKEVLIEALVEDSFERIGAQAVAALEIEDPWEAFAGVLWFGGEILASNRGLSEWLTTMAVDVPPGPQLALHESMRAVIARGQAAGVVRPDLCVDDIPMLMCGIGTATRKPHTCADSWRRHLSIVLDGLRASAAVTPLQD